MNNNQKLWFTLEITVDSEVIMIKSAGVEKHRVLFFWEYHRGMVEIYQEKASNGSLTIACSAQFKLLLAAFIIAINKRNMMLPVD